jgi:DNA-binding LacI/PurR family transcriptional regulator
MTALKQLAEAANVPMLTAYQALRGHEGVPPAVRQHVEATAAALHYTLNITIRDVAAYAGVSVGTVSYVLNDSPRTRPQTRERVLQAIQDLDYQRNSIARGLKSNQSRLIGYAWHQADDPVRRNALLDRFLFQMAQAAETRGYHILTFAQPDLWSVHSYEELIRMVRVDGFVLSDVEYHDARVRYLIERGVPVATFGRGDDEWDVPSVEVDGRAGMRLAVEHLLERGHERIALLCWPAGMRVGDTRAEGYREALAAAGLPARQELIGRTRNSIEGAMDATRQLLAASPRPTAIACANDVMAFGVMRCLEQAGLKAGADIAVTGYDDTPVAELLGLTSLRQPTEAVAVWVIEQLVGEIQAVPAPRRHILLEPSLIVRASSARKAPGG